jgi:cytochrome c peroxidase
VIPATAKAEIGSVEAEIDRVEADALARSAKSTLDRSQQLILLGKLLFYDRNLSVARNEACAFCHMPETGFSGPVSALNQTTVSYPGSIRTRFGKRNPQAHAFASFSPTLHYNAEQGDLVGGAFWDMRATGIRLNSPLAEQAQDPPLDPVEMGLIDAACMVYRLSERPYRLFGRAFVGRTGVRDSLASQRESEMRAAGAAVSFRSLAGTSRAGRSGDRTEYVRQYRARHHDLRRIRGCQFLLLQIRLLPGGKGSIHCPGAAGLCPFSQ